MRMYRSSILGLRSASKYPRLNVVVLGLVLGDDLPAEPAAALEPCPQFRLLLLAEEPAPVQFGELEVRHTFVDEPDEVALHGLCRSDSAQRLRGLPDVGPELCGDGFDRPWKADRAEPQQAKEKKSENIRLFRMALRPCPGGRSRTISSAACSKCSNWTAVLDLVSNSVFSWYRSLSAVLLRLG